MRVLEIVLVAIQIALIIGLLLGRQGGQWWCALLASALVAHAFAEGLRWHFVPVYVFIVWLSVAYGYPRLGEPGRASAVAGAAAALIAVLCSSVLPVFHLPWPTGPYRTGTSIRHLVDSSRVENEGGSGTSRELMAQFWYPADVSGRRQEYRGVRETSLKTENLSLVRTRSSRNVPLVGSPERHPVLVYAPSWTGRRGQNTVLAEELASYGFIIVAIDHPYATQLTVFPDGREIPTELGEALDFSSDESLSGSLRNAEEQIGVRTRDLSFVLDELERFNNRDPEGLFTGRIDLSRIGVFGYSFGGAVCADIAQRDPRVKAAANLDGLLFGDSLESAIGKPFLYLCDDTPVPDQEAIESAVGDELRYLAFLQDNATRSLESMGCGGGYRVRIQGTNHANFCDSPLYTPLKRLTGAGEIPPKHAMAIINECLTEFFEHHLKEGPVPSFPISSADPRVEIDAVPAQNRGDID